jgi:CheY-like chemotaxis protein
MVVENESAPSIDILLVEDNKADENITLRAFDKVQFNNVFHVVRDGEEALDFIYGLKKYQDHQNSTRPDLILLDINLPKIDGFAVLKKIKADSRYRDIPVIMLTSSGSEGDISDSFDYGACSYIQKPVSFQKCIEMANGFGLYWQVINRFPPKQRK